MEAEEHAKDTTEELEDIIDTVGELTKMIEVNNQFRNLLVARLSSP